MTMMEYSDFKQILNKFIFERSKADLLEKAANSPSRYIGLFRPTTPKGKILQNLFQSHEIRFGNAFEEIIEIYLKKIGFEIKNKVYNDNRETIYLDQCFYRDGKVYFLEQKIRDDHDSSKKRGQIQNFEKKLNVMITNYPESRIIGIFYFLDPELVKNKGFYENELERMKNDYGIELNIFYGKELFEYLSKSCVWEEITQHLLMWKKEIPDMPEVNFDKNPEETFEEIKDLKPLVFRRILNDDNVYNEIISVIFPDGTTLKLLKEYFQRRKEYIYQQLANKIDERLK